MKFECSAMEMYNGLVNATRALASKPPNPVLEGVSLTANDQGVEMICSDGSMSISTKVNAAVSDSGSVILPGRLLTEVCRKQPEGTLVFSLNDKLVMNVKGNRSRANISGTDAEFPMMEDLSAVAPVHLNKEDFASMISKVTFAIAANEARVQLTGCLFELNCDEMRLVALDGFRLAMQVKHGNFIMPDGMPQIKAIIPGRVMNELEHIMSASEEKEITLRFTSGHMMANIGGVTLVTSLLAGEFINYRQILPTTWLTRVTVKRAELMNAVERASLIAREGKNNLIRMMTGDGLISITANSELGDAFEELDATLEGEPITIAFNARYVYDVLRNVEDEVVTLRMNTNVSPCIIAPSNGEDYLYLILPVRVYN